MNVNRTLIAFLAVAGSVAAQQPATKSSTQTPAKKSGSAAAPAKKSSAPASPFNRALLNPANLKAKAPATYDVKLTTTKGDVVVRVTREWAPAGADRFYNLVKNRFYDDASFFRVANNFVVQFGLSAYPQVNDVWQQANIPDDRVRRPNAKGTLTFATAGPNTRTTQVFINLKDNGFLDSQGFAPFGEVVEGMSVVAQFYGGYGEDPTGKQGQIAAGGKAYLAKNYPKLDSIVKATIVAGEAAATEPATKAPEKKAATTPTKKTP